MAEDGDAFWWADGYLTAYGKATFGAHVRDEVEVDVSWLEGTFTGQVAFNTFQIPSNVEPIAITLTGGLASITYTEYFDGEVLIEDSFIHPLTGEKLMGSGCGVLWQPGSPPGLLLQCTHAEFESEISGVIANQYPFQLSIKVGVRDVVARGTTPVM